MIGTFPTLPKYIVAVVPHTSWVDLILGVIVRNISGESINFVGKKELFGPLTGWFFRALGGAPIDRSGNKGSVDSMIAVFNAHTKFRIALAPEGTRKKVTQLRTGFYHIAKRLQIPIVPISFDYENKKVVIHPIFNTSKNEKKDMDTLESIFRGVVGYSKKNSF
ncbi:1-acyl-sn-glycerol-3-phosphate acyltransferase [Flavobacteriaceae bacterium]|nr:1-acyl-sn-glycerol-3-phosphate acyltransferase [Flavobacteriaceae bacterium]MDA8849305.1 1-acyl-sn-glycerol-3-phosphate acyltransferase [Flavobacteriaceae bacterium]MDB4063560.1 1-acyl-sn-glycerol-3-phosphate acyltransferase [Flavobacteriaceae bacterium]